MAEIRVERKRRSLLPLLLAILVLLLIAWWFLNRGAGDGAVGTSDTALVSSGIATPPATSDSAAGTVGDTAGVAAAVAAPSGPVADFVAFVSATSATRSEDEQHAYTAGGLRRLATALEGMNPAGAARAQVDLVRQKADSLGITAEGDDRHADMTRAAFLAAAEAMRALPNAAGASAPLASVTRAAEAVRPDRHMLEQKDQIQAFFDAAREALRALGGTGAA